MSQPMRVGIAGLSTAATWALREAMELPFVRIAAAADLRQDALVRFREEFDAQVYSDIGTMCRTADIDVVLVGTPPELRPEHTILAAECGKHVIVEKPMALSLAEAARMNAAAESRGVKLLCGHTHNFDPPIVRMGEIVREGRLGKLCMTRDLTVSRGLIFNQTIHQVNLVRLIGGGMVKSVRATVGRWEPSRPFVSGYVCHLEFDDGVPATMVYGGMGYFDIAELLWDIGESGRPRDLATGGRARGAFEKLDPNNREQLLEQMKERVRYGPAGLKNGASHASWSGSPEAQPEKHQPFFGLTLVSCEKGDIRQSPDGLFVYDANGKAEMPLPPAIGQRQAEFFELYDAIQKDRPVVHDGRWGQASLEVCLAILRSAEERREIQLAHQVAARP
jgi:phthalate 4,5-cis-dihydrodiol dehydrogenase